MSTDNPMRVLLRSTFTYDITTEASAEHGDYAEHGWCDHAGEFRAPMDRKVFAMITTADDTIADVVWADRYTDAVKMAAHARKLNEPTAQAVSFTLYHRPPDSPLTRQQLWELSDRYVLWKCGEPDEITVGRFDEWAEDNEEPAWSDTPEEERRGALETCWRELVQGDHYGERSGSLDGWDLYVIPSSDEYLADETIDGTPGTFRLCIHAEVTSTDC